MKYIALTGPKFSGKSTLAAELERRGYMYINFTDQLKDLLAVALEAVGVHSSREEILARKEEYRALLVEFSGVIGFNHDTSYVIRSLRQWEQAGRPPAVFDNVRFVEQFLHLSRRGFELVYLDLPPALQFSRAIAAHPGLTYEQFALTLSDRSESAIPSEWFDLVVDASSDVAQIADMLSLAGTPLLSSCS